MRLKKKKKKKSARGETLFMILHGNWYGFDVQELHSSSGSYHIVGYSPL